MFLSGTPFLNPSGRSLSVYNNSYADLNNAPSESIKQYHPFVRVGFRDNELSYPHQRQSYATFAGAPAAVTSTTTDSIISAPTPAVVTTTQCKTGSDCKDSKLPYCNMSSGKCVGCLYREHCVSGIEYCNTSGKCQPSLSPQCRY